jgi:hypothetical protein
MECDLHAKLQNLLYLQCLKFNNRIICTYSSYKLSISPLKFMLRNEPKDIKILQSIIYIGYTLQRKN